MNNELTVIVEKRGLQPEQAKPLFDSFGDYFVKAHKLATYAKAIKVTSVDQVDEMKKARELRLELKSLRVEADKTRVSLKEGYLRVGNAIQDIYNDIRDIVKPMEEHLELQEKYAEKIKAEEEAKIERDRFEKLSKYVDDASVYSLHPQNLSTESFDKLLETSRIAFEATKEAERKAEEERIAKEKAEKAEQERIRKENEKLKKEAEERAKAEAERQRVADEKLKAEREAREKAEAKLKAEKEAQQKAEMEKKAKEEAEQKAKEEAERKALLAPDREKLLEYADRIWTFTQATSPALKSKVSQEVRDEAESLLNEAVEILRSGAKKL